MMPNTINKPLDLYAPEEIDRLADQLAKDCTRDKLKTNQLRNFYAAILKIRTDITQGAEFQDIKRTLIMLKPRLAYAAGRQEAVNKHFYPVVKSAIEQVQTSQDQALGLENFIFFFEALVGYHKYYENRKKH